MASQPGSTDTNPAFNQELVAAARREIVSAPINDLATTKRFIESINNLRDLAEGMSRGIEQFTYLKAVEHSVLKVIAKDISHPRHIGRRLGMDKEVVTACLLVLEEKGFVHVSERIGDRIIDVVVSDQGHAALAQAEAIQFRSLDAVLKQAPDMDVQRLLYLLDEATDLATNIAVQLAGSAPSRPL